MAAVVGVATGAAAQARLAPPVRAAAHALPRDGRVALGAAPRAAAAARAPQDPSRCAFAPGAGSAAGIGAAVAVVRTAEAVARRGGAAARGARRCRRRRRACGARASAPPQAAPHLAPDAPPGGGAAPPRSALLRSGAAGVVAAAIGGLLPGGAHAAAGALADLRGRFAVVTGASRGIGKGVAVGLAEAGATVFVTGRDAAKVAATAAAATEAGGEGVAMPCDHNDDQQVAAVFKEVEKRTGGRLDILVNNAFKDPTAGNPEVDRQLNAGAKFFEMPLSVWDDMHNVGLRSHYVASYYAAPLLLASAKRETSSANPWRPLLCMTSSFGAVSYLFTTAYGVGKAASDRLVRDLQVELGPQGVDCLSVWPGLVLTEKVDELLRTNPARIDRITGGQDPARVGESPVLTGRVLARLAEDPRLRTPKGGLVTPDGLTGRVCIVAEAAKDLGIRDGGAPGSVAATLYGPPRAAAPSIRSLGFLGPGPLRAALPEALRGLAAPGGPLANDGVRLPLEFMAQGPPA